MATETDSEHVSDAEMTTTGGWQAGVIAGLSGGAVMGVMLTIAMRPVIEHAIPALWGLDGGLAGWIIHMSNAAIFGVIFAAVATQPSVRNYTTSLGQSAVLGIGYGVVLWIVAAVIVMPLWLQAVGFANAPAFPNISMKSLMGHIIYGLVLGLVYPAIRDRRT
ncbi:histidine kinase [Haladaptatus halobius]|uniref:histidine kinase n=1 Tax=Haladaptatus halobius TaxID=2884875 RepID=UPI001D0ACA3C|nr:histidine kinase [Haladaptatus halobius]